MVLVWLIVILMVGGLAAWGVSSGNRELSRWISLLAVAGCFAISLGMWIPSIGAIGSQGNWLQEVQAAWIPSFGISFHLAMDGLSLLMLVLTFFLGLLSILISWKEIEEQVGFFHFNLLWILAGITGVFVAMDLFLFYFFWEVMLIPMYFLIGIWGHENRIYAAYKFFIFTQASGLLMLLSILGLYFVHGQATGIYTFDYMQLLGTSIAPQFAMWLMLGFLIAFVVKLPVVPFHNWLPDAHTEAPTAGSVILAGLLLKTGAYGMLRFVVPLFPEVSMTFAPVAFILGAISVLYGAKLAFAQFDLKRLVAYSSVSHMGFIMLGVFAFNELAYQGVLLQMITHGISTGALFIMVGNIQERIHTRDLHEMGGLWEQAPKMGTIGLVFAMASLGLPGLGNFIAEFLVLIGAYQANVLWTIIASVGLIASSVYSLRIMQKVFYGEKEKSWEFSDLNLRELGVMASLVIVIVWLGLYPQPVINTAKSSLNGLLENVKMVDNPDQEKDDSRANIQRLNESKTSFGKTYFIQTPAKTLTRR